MIPPVRLVMVMADATDAAVALAVAVSPKDENTLVNSGVKIGSNTTWL